MHTRRAIMSLAAGGLLLVPGLGIVLPARCQQTVASASLSGRVEDTGAAAISGATIIMTNTERNQTSTTTTDEDGRYKFPYLPVGTYQLRVEHSGFASVSRELSLSVGQALDLAVRLSVAGMNENVTVSGEMTVIETVRTQVGETVAPKAIESLPLNGRNYLDLALLIPAVSRTNTGSNQRFAETSAVPGTGISVAGQRNLNNGFIMDGL
ncbi:MAG: carboxypeptidase-like regulatory domain-containing protein, partial [Blastocatellia bacterium]